MKTEKEKENGKIEFIRDELKKKGYPLENYVQSLLVKKEWHVQPNAYFLDKDTGKGRELDIKAIYEGFESDSWSAFAATLLIQCRRLPGNAWIFFSTPATISRSISKYGLADFLKCSDLGIFDTKETHFDKSEVLTTNYCEIIIDKEKSNKRDDNIWECVMTLIKATSQEMEWPLADSRLYLEHDLGSYEAFAESPFEVVWFSYPLIVFEGEIYEAKFLHEEIALKKRKYVQLSVDYISGRYKGEFCIDIITKERFADYLRDMYEDLTLFNKRRVKKKREYEKHILRAVKGHFKQGKTT